MRSTLAVTLGALAFLTASPAVRAQLNTPAKANKFFGLFVRSYLACTSPTTSHNAPLSFGACVPSTGEGPPPATFFLHFNAGGVAVPGGTATTFLDDVPSSASVPTATSVQIPRFTTGTFPTFTGTPLAAGLTLPSQVCAISALSANQPMSACAPVHVDLVHVHANGTTTPIGGGTTTGTLITRATNGGTVGFSPNPVTVNVTGDSAIPAGDSIAMTTSVDDECSTSRTVWQAYEATATEPALVLTPCASIPVSFGAKGSCSLAGVVQVNPSKQASDIAVTARCADVRAFGGPFSGDLVLASTVRITDDFCASGVPCTRIDVPFPIPMACGISATPPLTPGRCSAKTSFNTLLPGVVVPGESANVEVGQWQVFHGTETVFTRGLFLQ